jgi:hypothetical protein
LLACFDHHHLSATDGRSRGGGVRFLLRSPESHGATQAAIGALESAEERELAQLMIDEFERRDFSDVLDESILKVRDDDQKVPTIQTQRPEAGGGGGRLATGHTPLAAKHKGRSAREAGPNSRHQRHEQRSGA